jgi:hypothetical protein
MVITLDKTLTNNYHFNESGYEQRVLLFADALGFSEYSSKPENYNVVTEFIKEIQNIGKESNFQAFFEVEMWNTPGLYEYSLLSDTLLISFPLAILSSYKWSLEALLLRFTNLLGVMNKIDINFPFLRGAIVSGLLYHKNSIIFGPALIDAYRLERHNAKNPRIIIAKELEAFMGKEYFNNDNLFINDEDYYVVNIYYADFGDVLHRLIEDGDYYFPGAEFGEVHLHAWKNKIENGLKSTYCDKYDYLKKQWNRKVNEFCKIDIVKECSWIYDELLIK